MLLDGEEEFRATWGVLDLRDLASEVSIPGSLGSSQGFVAIIIILLLCVGSIVLRA